MDTLVSCLNLMERECFMASIDLENAYHSVPVHPDYTKFLKFIVEDQLYKYLVLPQGYRDSPRLFTKITKPIIAHLHDKGILCSLYIDDLYIQGSNYTECKQSVEYACKLFKSLGFDISPKSIMIPSQTMHHLGFVLDSVTMTVSLGREKIEHVEGMIFNILNKRISVRVLAQLIGTLVACFPGVEYGQLYYRSLEFLKIDALNKVYNFEAEIVLSTEAICDLQWWLCEGLLSNKSLIMSKPKAVIKTDASSYAWGAVMNHVTTHGMWSDSEKKDHINTLELRAAMLGIQSLCQKLSNCSLRVEMDNTTAVAYINNMGGTHSAACNAITRQILLWCKARGIDFLVKIHSLRALFSVNWGVDGTVASESALGSAGTILWRVRAPLAAPWPDGGPESLRSPCSGLAIYKNETNLSYIFTGETVNDCAHEGLKAAIPLLFTICKELDNSYRILRAWGSTLQASEHALCAAYAHF
ncbi:hypothetical protein PoB_001425900 [Plakobranchus ocellatus]|uniref:Reverse transcriptase domain-containing protein n=1 Tax=Plakobranchus ocellatus TaxID=259542 RepID=A0AAV3Z024_9GAST|nr:hypothetical protein PoB_001425900 [Plakobranchus ocellatus]